MAEFKPDINQARRVLGLSDDAFLVAQTPQQKYGVWVPEHRHHIHIPFTFYRQNDENDPGKWLYFWVNPSECAWTMALHSDTRCGFLCVALASKTVKIFLSV